MQLVKTYPSGAEEWECVHCERRFVVNWPPRYQKIILETGNEYAVHGGGKGGLQLTPRLKDTSLSDEWHAAFDELDFGDWPEESE